MAEVSVVIPVRDDARHLQRCLAALDAQTVTPLEVIVVDNGSTDDSAVVARAHGARVVTEPRAGIPAAAATGYDAATGTVIARLDADSLPPADWVQRVVEALERRPEAVAVTGVGVFRDPPPGVRQLLSVVYLGSYYLLGGLAAGHHVLWGSSMAVRRDAWEQVSRAVHRDDPELHDDMDLALVLGPGARIALVPALAVGVSARSVRGGTQWRRRLRRAFRTLEVNWRDVPPWERWAARLGLPAPRHTSGRETT
jgi:glycosyltransferase involved in cell wall biosynthesis